MNYLKEIEPLYQRVELYLQGKGMPNREQLEELCDIEYRLKESEKVTIYGNSNAEVYPTDLGCQGCVKAMMENLQRWYKIKSKEAKQHIKDEAKRMVGWTDDTVEFKGVPQVDVDRLKDEYGATEELPTIDVLKEEARVEKELGENWGKGDSIEHDLPIYKIELDEDSDVGVISIVDNPEDYASAPFKTMGSNDNTSKTIGDDLPTFEHDEPIYKTRPEDMKWGAFKTYCKEQGLSVKGKKKTQLLDELKAL